MDSSLKISCTICARGGSKGVKNKNIRNLQNKPLIALSIEQALACELFSVIAVSSDSPEILDTALKWGATHVIERPAHLATDKAAKIPVIQHAVIQSEKLSEKKLDICVDLDAYAPLRTTKDILGCFDLLQKSKASNVITGTKARKSPYFNLAEQSQNSREAAKKIKYKT